VFGGNFFSIYSFFSLTIVCWWAAGSVALFVSSWIFMQFQTQASVMLHVEFEGGC
jgi:hypothetical protein